MTTIGHGIATASGDGMVDIYDSVAGVPRLSLSSPHPIKTMTGSPDGCTLFRTHRDTPSITSWDIQTGGRIHTFVLKSKINNTAISLNGRFLACGLSDGSVKFWDITSRMEGTASESGPSNTCVEF